MTANILTNIFSRTFCETAAFGWS